MATEALGMIECRSFAAVVEAAAAKAQRWLSASIRLTRPAAQSSL